MKTKHLLLCVCLFGCDYTNSHVAQAPSHHTPFMLVAGDEILDPYEQPEDPYESVARPLGLHESISAHAITHKVVAPTAAVHPKVKQQDKKPHTCVAGDPMCSVLP